MRNLYYFLQWVRSCCQRAIEPFSRLFGFYLSLFVWDTAGPIIVFWVWLLIVALRLHLELWAAHPIERPKILFSWGGWFLALAMFQGIYPKDLFYAWSSLLRPWGTLFFSSLFTGFLVFGGVYFLLLIVVNVYILKSFLIQKGPLWWKSLSPQLADLRPSPKVKEALVRYEDIQYMGQKRPKPKLTHFEEFQQLLAWVDVCLLNVKPILLFFFALMVFVWIFTRLSSHLMLVMTSFTQLRDSTMLDRDLVFMNYLKSFTGKSLLTMIALQACLFVLGSYWQSHSYFVMLFVLFYLVFSLYTWMMARYWAYRLKFHGLAINLLVISDVAFILLLLSLQWLETLAGFDVPFDSILEFSIYELKRHRCLWSCQSLSTFFNVMFLWKLLFMANWFWNICKESGAWPKHLLQPSMLRVLGLFFCFLFSFSCCWTSLIIEYSTKFTLSMDAISLVSSMLLAALSLAFWLERPATLGFKQHFFVCCGFWVLLLLALTPASLSLVSFCLCLFLCKVLNITLLLFLFLWLFEWLL